MHINDSLQLPLKFCGGSVRIWGGMNLEEIMYIVIEAESPTAERYIDLNLEDYDVSCLWYRSKLCGFDTSAITMNFLQEYGINPRIDFLWIRI